MTLSCQCFGWSILQPASGVLSLENKKISSGNIKPKKWKTEANRIFFKFHLKQQHINISYCFFYSFSITCTAWANMKMFSDHLVKISNLFFTEQIKPHGVKIIFNLDTIHSNQWISVWCQQIKISYQILFTY